VTFDDVVAEEITTWSPVQKSRPESPVCSVVCDVGEVGGRGRRERQPLSTRRPGAAARRL